MDDSLSNEPDEIVWQNENDENDEENYEGHEKLLQVVQSLDANKFSRKPRTEPALNVSDIYTGADRGKVKVHELVGSLKKEVRFGVLKQQLNKVQRRQKVLQTPLAKPEQQRIERKVAYEETKKEVAKWDSVVDANRKADQLQFPLLQTDVRLVTTNDLVKRFKPRTPLEMEIAAILEGREPPSEAAMMRVLTPAEQRAQTAMSLQEARERREEMQKLRALISYQETKARRKHKIKSKRYHKILKKERIKKDKQVMEELKIKDPEESDKILAKIEKDRATERMTQRHRTGSKFMLRQKLFSRYDDQARKAIDEMIETGKQLKQKVPIESDSEDEVVTEGYDVNMITDEKTENPWMKPDTSKNIYKQPAAFKADDDERSSNQSRCSDSEIETFISDEEIGVCDIAGTKNGSCPTNNSKNKKDAIKKNANAKKVIESKYNEEDDASENDEALVSEGLTRIRTLEDIEDADWEHLNDINLTSKDKVSSGKKKQSKPLESQLNKNDVVLDIKKVITIDKRIGSGVNGIAMVDDEENEDDRRMTIAQAFASDDVMEEFVAEKKAVLDRDKPKDIDLTLPGWGDWAGTGLKPSRRKRKRFTVKAVEIEPRKDRNLDNVIISETKDVTIAKYQVNELPFPFANTSQFESSIRAPIGKTWNPETSYRELIKPKKITTLGAIIEPISKEATLPKNLKIAHVSNDKISVGDKKAFKTKNKNLKERKLKVANKQ